MSIPGGIIIENQILARLPARDYGQLKPALKHVHLTKNEILCAPGDDAKYLYFPNNAIVSLMLSLDDRLAIEVAMEGNEGAVGLAASLGKLQSSTFSIVRVAGSAFRLNAKVMLPSDPAHKILRRSLNSYLHGLLIQIAQLGVCNQFHSIEARLARWLLMSQDRVGSSTLDATQKSIGQMLGVRRSSITDAARNLRKLKSIRYSRGHIEIINQALLAESACSCYDIMKLNRLVSSH